MKWTIDHVDYLNLRKAICGALDDSLRIRKVGNKEVTEPQLVANLVWHLPKKINAVKILGPSSIKVGGIFVHGQPFVKFKASPATKPKSVEIGDLLLIQTRIKKGSVCNRRAMLLQAKKVSAFPAKPDNAHQHHLYANWPSFEYVRSTKKLNGKKRHATGYDLHSASKYLLIGKNGHRNHILAHKATGGYGVMTASPTMPILTNYDNFLWDLLDFILGDTGKSFVLPPRSRTRNWDRVMEDLITVTTNSVSKFTGNASAGSANTRGVMSHFLCGDFSHNEMLLNTIPDKKRFNGGNEPPSGYEEWPGQIKDGSGISIIEFLVSSDNKTND